MLDVSFTDDDEDQESDNEAESRYISTCQIVWKDKSFSLFQGDNIVGRGQVKNADVALNHSSVSDIHAEISIEGDKFTIKDFDSENCTFVKNPSDSHFMKVKRKKIQIFDGAFLRFGYVECTFSKNSIQDELKEEEKNETNSKETKEAKKNGNMDPPKPVDILQGGLRPAANVNFRITASIYEEPTQFQSTLPFNDEDDEDDEEEEKEDEKDGEKEADDKNKENGAVPHSSSLNSNSSDIFFTCLTSDRLKETSTTKNDNVDNEKDKKGVKIQSNIPVIINKSLAVVNSHIIGKKEEEEDDDMTTSTDFGLDEIEERNLSVDLLMSENQRVIKNDEELADTPPSSPLLSKSKSTRESNMFSPDLLPPPMERKLEKSVSESTHNQDDQGEADPYDFLCDEKDGDEKKPSKSKHEFIERKTPKKTVTFSIPPKASDTQDTFSSVLSVELPSTSTKIAFERNKSISPIRKNPSNSWDSDGSIDFTPAFMPSFDGSIPMGRPTDSMETIDEKEGLFNDDEVEPKFEEEKTDPNKMIVESDNEANDIALKDNEKKEEVEKINFKVEIAEKQEVPEEVVQKEENEKQKENENEKEEVIESGRGKRKKNSNSEEVKEKKTVGNGRGRKKVQKEETVDNNEIKTESKENVIKENVIKEDVVKEVKEEVVVKKKTTRSKKSKINDGSEDIANEATKSQINSIEKESFLSSSIVSELSNYGDQKSIEMEKDAVKKDETIEKSDKMDVVEEPKNGKRGKRKLDKNVESSLGSIETATSINTKTTVDTKSIDESKDNTSKNEKKSKRTKKQDTEENENKVSEEKAVEADVKVEKSKSKSKSKSTKSAKSAKSDEHIESSESAEPGDSGDSNEVRLVFSGIDPEPELARRLGAVVVSRAQEASHLIVGELKRTAKLLVGLNCGLRHVLSRAWLRDSAKAGRPLPLLDSSGHELADYCVRDAARETQWRFSLRETLSKPRAGRLFAGLAFVISESVCGVAAHSEDEMKEVIASGGGQWIDRKVFKEREGGENEEKVVVVSTKEAIDDGALYKLRLAGGSRVYSPEMIYLSVLRQEVCLDENIIHVVFKDSKDENDEKTSKATEKKKTTNTKETEKKTTRRKK